MKAMTAYRQVLVAATMLALGFGLARHGAAEEATIGYVKTLSGSAFLTRDGVTTPLQAAAPILEKDRVQTGGDGQLGITFRDDTRVALGPDSRLDITRFVFRPATKEYGFVMRLLFGTLHYVSGLTAKLAPEQLSIETPSSTIAVRGTRFLVRVEH
jgi:hypothetical protein